MEGLSQYLVPYLVSQVAAIMFLMIAYRNTRVTRLLFAFIFIGASGINLSTGLTNPDTYLEYAKMALPFYSRFISGWFSQYNDLIVPAIAVGQFLVGAGMLLRGWWVRLACIGAILFLLGITPLMVGSAFPFPLLVGWAAVVVLRRDRKDFLWRVPVPLYRHPLPGSSSFSVAVFLSWLAWMLTTVACTTGLFAPNIYRDNDFVQTVWRANDWVTLLLVVPALPVVLLFRQNIRARLVWAGLLGYLIYNYAFYLVGAAFNVNFLVYAGIIAFSIWAVVGLLQTVPIQTLRVRRRHHRWISGYLFFMALMLMAIEMPPAMAFGFSGAVPDIVVKTNHPTSVVYALDLTLIVPALVAAGYWLWKGKGWGIALAVIMLVKAAAYGLVLCTGTILLMVNKVDRDPLLPFYAFIAVGGITGLVFLLRSIKMRGIIAVTDVVTAPGAGIRTAAPTMN